MDAVFFSTFGFTILKVVMWILLLLWAFGLLRKIVPALSSPDVPPSDTLWKHRWGICLWAVALVAALFVTNVETAYRPKNTIDTKNQQREEQLREVDNATLPEVKPVTRDTPTAEEAEAKNRAENEAARKAFEELPDATPRQP